MCGAKRAMERTQRRADTACPPSPPCRTAAVQGKSALRSAASTDLQIHNAIVGHAHDFENAPIAEQMRRVVLPGHGKTAQPTRLRPRQNVPVQQSERRLRLLPLSSAE